jgi:hypothetical protein
MYEALTAFFLEGAFIGIMLFGEKLIGRVAHLFASVMVTLGTMLSAFWVLAANSWMQTPQGAYLGRDGIFHVTSWAAVIFNPSMPYRFAHMVCASLVSGTFVIAGVSAVFLLRQRHDDFARTGVSLAMWFALILVPIQLEFPFCLSTIRFLKSLGGSSVNSRSSLTIANKSQQLRVAKLEPLAHPAGRIHSFWNPILDTLLPALMPSSM